MDTSNMSVLEYAMYRRDDPNNEEYETRYWAAYIDGVNARTREYESMNNRDVDREN